MNNLGVEKISFEEVGVFSPIFKDYINQKLSLKDFYHTSPKLESFQSVVSKKEFDHRSILIKRLRAQYDGIELTRETAENISLLQNQNTYTVTTGHQLQFMTGPLFFIYKIISTISTCRALKNKYPDYNFVPIFWMASEDHDFDEIKSVNLFGKDYVWETDQKGPVGRFHTKEIAAVLNQLPEKSQLLEETYSQNESLSKATRKLVHELFGSYGLVILDADDKDLKKIFAPCMLKEIKEQKSVKLLNNQSHKLAQLGYRNQVFARKINLFRITDTSRKRLEEVDGIIREVDGDWSCELTKIDEYVSAYPEEFSPNVVLRPIYQETILPNITYIGGPAEVAYWLQLKTVFEYFGLQMPVVMPRIHALLLASNQQKKIEKLQLNTKDLFLDEAVLRKMIVEREEKIPSLEPEMKEVIHVFQKISQKIDAIDPSLKATVAAEEKKVEKQLQLLYKKMEKAGERKHDSQISQVQNLKDRLFPKGTLQERHENIFSFYINNPEVIHQLIDCVDAFDYRFTIINLK